MRTKFIPTAIISLLAILFLAQIPAEQIIGPHGGLVKPAGNYNIEMKNSSDFFFAYLLDKKLKPISNLDMSCKVEFFFPSNLSIDAQLEKDQDDGFFTQSASTYFQYCKLTFNYAGEEIQARFENQNPLVLK